MRTLTACDRRRSPSASATDSCIWSSCISDSLGRPLLRVRHGMRRLRKYVNKLATVFPLPGGEPPRHTKCAPAGNAADGSGSYLMTASVVGSPVPGCKRTQGVPEKSQVVRAQTENNPTCVRSLIHTNVLGFFLRDSVRKDSFDRRFNSSAQYIFQDLM